MHCAKGPSCNMTRDLISTVSNKQDVTAEPNNQKVSP